MPMPMPPAELTALLLLSTAASFSPGPNTALSTALGANLGLRHALRFVCAVPVGWGLLFTLCAAGLGAVVGVKTTAGRMTQDPETTASLCRNVPGLGVTLDPSHFIHGHKKPASWESILKYVCHVHLRDTKPDAFQVRIGQGDVEYGKIVGQLQRVGYKRALCAHLPPMEGIDQVAELRKMRLLLESLL